jgi:alpha-galactosidase
MNPTTTASSTIDGCPARGGRWLRLTILAAGALLPGWALAADRVILTPRPGPGPRIHGAKVFGVRPGSPFLFRIPATGERPLRYGATGLPKGLRLDEVTGRIGGHLDRAGRHDVVLEVSNARGRDSRRLLIACGATLALTPHMGWNSWYIWGDRVSDKIVRESADAMVRSGMIDHGYIYVNIDDGWAIKPGDPDPELGGEPRDARGRVNPNRRFPDMKGLVDDIHSRGLKAGIYTSPGLLTCSGYVGAYRHEEQDVRRFVEWGFDFLKYDWCSYGQVIQNRDQEALQAPYRRIGEILRRQPRDVVLNLCQYGMGDVWEWGRAVGGQSWRTAGDFGMTFDGIPVALFRDGFDLHAARELHRFGGPGGWNDPDYLLLGYLNSGRGKAAPTPLSPDEQYAHVSLWCLLAAPLIFSGDMTRLDDFTLGLLCNDEVIDVDQDPLGRPGRRVARDGPLEVWARPLEDGSLAVGLFNRGGQRTTVTARWSDLGVSGTRNVRDLWRQKDLGAYTDQFQADVARHGVVLVRVSAVT